MRRAELVVAYEAHVGEALLQLSFDHRKDLVSPEDVVPEKRNRLAFQGVEPWCERLSRNGRTAARPVHGMRFRGTDGHGVAPRADGRVRTRTEAGCVVRFCPGCHCGARRANTWRCSQQ